MITESKRDHSYNIVMRYIVKENFLFPDGLGSVHGGFPGSAWVDFSGTVRTSAPRVRSRLIFLETVYPEF